MRIVLQWNLRTREMVGTYMTVTCLYLMYIYMYIRE